MAHGIGATQDSGLIGFAEELATAGVDVVRFDYRHFAASGGEPRQLVSPAKQIEDYLAVVAAARNLDGVDSTRIVVWGVSLSGGHVWHVADQDPDVAAVIALTPAVDGVAVVRTMLRSQSPAYFLAMARLALGDAMAARRGRPPVMAPIVGEPGEPAALNARGAKRLMMDLAGPSWRNEFAARLFLAVAAYRPTTTARGLRRPVLVQVGTEDRSALPGAAEKAARAAGATLHRYPCDHFDVYPGQRWHERVLADQIAFLRRVMASRYP